MILNYFRRSIYVLTIAASILATALTAFGQAQNTDTTAKAANETSDVKVAIKTTETTAKSEKTAVVAESDTEKTAIVAKNYFAEGGKVSTDKPTYPGDSKTAPAAPSKQTTDSGWHIASAPYLYITGLKGTLGARGRTIEIDLSFGDVMSSFKIGLMGAFEARKNKFVLVNDIIWLRLGEERTNSAGSAFSSSDIKVKTFIWDTKAGYRVAEGKAGALDILGGFRLISLENELNTTTGVLPGFNVSQRKTWATPIGGLHGTLNINEKIFLATLFDIGGGWGSDLTMQAYGGMGYRFNPKVSLVGGWRYMKNDYNDNTGFVFDTTMNGLIIGARIQMK